MTDDPRQILLSYAARVSSAVVERLGDGSVESIFVSGSAGRGEIASFRGPSEIEIYSDLDLFVIVRAGADLERDRPAARAAAAAVPRSAPGYTIFPEPDVGVFTPEDFLAQKNRPGMAEIAASHVVLHGAADAPGWARRFVAREIVPAEGLYLIENRLNEISVLADRLDGESAAGFRRYARYVLLKSRLDAAAGALVALGLFDPSRAAQIRTLRDSRTHDDVRRLVPDVACAEAEGAYREWADLQTTLASQPPVERADGARAARVLLDSWRRIAEYVTNIKAIEWSFLFEWRCKRGRRLENARELLILARRRSIPRGGVLRRAWGLARLSPVDALRLAGAARMLEATAREKTGAGGVADGAPQGYLGFLESLTRVFGYTTGDVFTRARRMFEETA